MVHNDKVLEDVNALLDYNAVKDYLFMTVINAEEHKNDLATMPHTIIGDLAIVYKIMIQTTNDRFCSARVTNQLMDQYGIDVNSSIRNHVDRNSKRHSLGRKRTSTCCSDK